MIKARQTWNGPAALASVKASAWEGVVRAVVFLWTECQKAVSRPNPPPHRTPSLPGEPPKLRTGEGRGTILYDLDEPNLVGRVGVAAGSTQRMHMLWLELAKSDRRRRPWHLATMQKHLQTLRRLAGG